MSKEKLIEEIISYISSVKSLETNLSEKTKILEEIIDFDSLELAGLVAHLEEITDFDPFEGGFVEFETISELAQLFIRK